MRPKRQTQEPHHFLKRWPREKRMLRGPQEIIEDVKVSLTLGECRKINSNPRAHLPEEMKVLLDKEARWRAPRGMDYAYVSHPDFCIDWDGGAAMRAKVRFYRLS
jgi:hypothetical protein